MFQSHAIRQFVKLLTVWNLLGETVPLAGALSSSWWDVSGTICLGSIVSILWWWDRKTHQVTSEYLFLGGEAGRGCRVIVNFKSQAPMSPFQGSSWCSPHPPCNYSLVMAYEKTAVISRFIWSLSVQKSETSRRVESSALYAFLGTQTPCTIP